MIVEIIWTSIFYLVKYAFFFFCLCVFFFKFYLFINLFIYLFIHLFFVLFFVFVFFLVGLVSFWNKITKVYNVSVSSPPPIALEGDMGSQVHILQKWPPILDFWWLLGVIHDPIFLSFGKFLSRLWPAKFAFWPPILYLWLLQGSTTPDFKT